MNVNVVHYVLAAKEFRKWTAPLRRGSAPVDLGRS
jgi:hypothetical protein